MKAAGFLPDIQKALESLEPACSTLIVSLEEATNLPPGQLAALAEGPQGASGSTLALEAP